MVINNPYPPTVGSVPPPIHLPLTHLRCGQRALRQLACRTAQHPVGKASGSRPHHHLDNVDVLRQGVVGEVELSKLEER